MKHLYQNREISTLSFNERVLQEAEDPRNPLMERLKFLGIFSSNMDEFFKVRVAVIQRMIELKKKEMKTVLEYVQEKAQELDDRFQLAYDDIVGQLAREGILIITEHELAHQVREIRQWVEHHFRDKILPNLVPIIVTKKGTFPQIKDGAIYFAIRMANSRMRYALLEIPDDLPRFLRLPNTNIMYLDDVIRYSLNDIFYIFDYHSIDAWEFKISRDAELDIDNDLTESYVRKMEKVLQQRKGGRPTRLVYDADMPEDLLDLLRKKLRIAKDDTLIGGGRYHNMKDLIKFPCNRHDLLFEPLEPIPHPLLDHVRRPMIELIRERDILVTYPYQSFDNVVRLLREAAIDPKVLAIKMTVYRVSRTSQIVNALVNAAKNGKNVFVSVELQARFDEQNNIAMSQKLTEAGATVAFGVPPMKVHCKLLHIHRKDGALACLSTGNYNEATAPVYVDSTLMTADARICKEVERVFEFLQIASQAYMLPQRQFNHLMVSPFNSRDLLGAMINREMKKKEDGYIFIKANHVTDDQIMEQLLEAAHKGVTLELVIRSTYAMHPHPNIRVISILDRYLEHQRVFIFGRGSDRKVYMSSSDLMERNLDRRVEVAFPLYDEELQQQVVDLMALQTRDNVKARILDEKQSNPYAGNGQQHLRSQHETHRYFEHLWNAATQPHAATPEATSSEYPGATPNASGL
jgi:polyphosphate kinase